MRRILIGLTAFTLLTVAFVVAVQGQVSDCTKIGTDGRDIMTGGKGRDALCLRAGNDYGHGDGGNDIIRAGAGRDTIVGAKGRDVLRGGAGNDRLFAVDDRGGDKVVGGKGRDQCFVDSGDQSFGCERIFRGLSIDLVRALEHLSFQVMTVAENGVTETITIGATTVAPVTVTVTHTASFPPCQPPPPEPPAPC